MEWQAFDMDCNNYGKILLTFHADNRQQALDYAKKNLNGNNGVKPKDSDDFRQPYQKRE